MLVFTLCVFGAALAPCTACMVRSRLYVRNDRVEQLTSVCSRCLCALVSPLSAFIRPSRHIDRPSSRGVCHIVPVSNHCVVVRGQNTQQQQNRGRWDGMGADGSARIDLIRSILRGRNGMTNRNLQDGESMEMGQKGFLSNRLSMNEAKTKEPKKKTKPIGLHCSSSLARRQYPSCVERIRLEHTNLPATTT